MNAFEPVRLRTRARIAAHSLWDLLTRPLAVDRDEVPWHGEAVTAEWLTAVMARATSGAAVEQVRIEGGDDGSSVRRRLSVVWNAAGQGAGLPTRLFTKTTPTLATRLSAGMAAPSEGRFLRDVRPRLDIEAPQCLHTARDPESGRSVHLFVDLAASRGATFCDVSSAIDRDQAAQIVDLLAQLHGSFLGPGEVDAVAWLGTYEGFFQAGQKSGIQAAHEAALTRAVEVIPAALLDRRDDIWPAAVRAAALHAESVRTVIHSDVHLGNWYVTADGAMGLCDWARVCRGSWARDVAYALATTLEIEDRRAWEDELIAQYLEKLHGKFGVTIGLDRALTAYRQQLFPALLMWTPTLCPPPMLPDMQPEAMSMKMIHRIATAIDDHRALESVA